MAERLATRLNELAGEELVRAHHGSIAREQRLEIEDGLKDGTASRASSRRSSLELGIDMGAVDLVIQVESPGSVARGLQRIGRAGHSGRRAVRRARSSRSTAATCSRPRSSSSACERARSRRRATCAIRSTCLPSRSSRCAPSTSGRSPNSQPSFAAPRTSTACPTRCSTSVLDLLAGRYPSDEFAELRPRIVWDRRAGRFARARARRRLAVTNGGTIPDRGLFGVFLADGDTRVGELDEEMVYESLRGDTFLLGASTWRIDDITHDRVLVSPAPGEPGRMPFWKGDGPGRPIELGRALGAFARTIRATEPRAARAACATEYALDDTGSAEPLALPATSSGGRPAPCPTTERSSSNVSATSSATGASASCRRSAPACTRRGRWRSNHDSPTGSVAMFRCCGATTASCFASPSRRSASPSRICSPTRTRSRTSCSANCRRPRFSRRVSASRRHERCCSRDAARDGEPRSGSNDSVRPTYSGSPRATRSSRCCSRRPASACATCSTCRP